MKHLLYVVILTLSTGSLFSQSFPTLKFRKPTTSDNITWKFSSVTSGVDAFITVVGSKNASLAKIDDSTKYAHAWNPEIKFTSTAGLFDSSYVEFRIQFRKAVDGTAAILPNMAMTIVDLDGGMNGIFNYREMVKTTLPATPKGLIGTLLSTITNSLWLTNISGATSYSVTDTANSAAMSQLNYTNLSSYNLKVGTYGRVGANTVREYSFYYKNFAPLTFVLPVKLVDFGGEAKESANMLQWSTTSEENSNRFEVYRSVNGQDFYLAGTVKAAGHSQMMSDYMFADQRSAEVSANTFYKLRMIDNDGNYTWSSIIQIRTEATGTKATVTSVYPNPTRGLLNVSLTATDSDFSVDVMDMFGKTVQSYGAADISNSILSLDLTGMSNGVYFIKVINSDGSSASSKFIKN
jgi:hypothetical protein